MVVRLVAVLVKIAQGTSMCEALDKNGRYLRLLEIREETSENLRNQWFHFPGTGHFPIFG
jgi:hypothetical protein